MVAGAKVGDVRKAGKCEKVSVSFNREQRAVLKKLADAHYNGNRSSVMVTGLYLVDEAYAKAGLQRGVRISLVRTGR